MEKETFAGWDPAEYITTKEDVIAFLEDALEANDPQFLLETIGHIVRSQGMAQLVSELEQNRTEPRALYAPGGNPAFAAVADVFDNLGRRLYIKQKKAS